MTITANDYIHSFSDYLTHIHGDLNTESSGPSGPNGRKKQKTYFIGSQNVLNETIGGDPAIIICQQKLTALCTENFPNSCVLECKNVTLVMALSNQKFFPVTRPTTLFDKNTPVHPTAVVHQSVKLGAQVVIGPNAVVCEGVEIGDFTHIGGNSYIEHGVKVGNNTHIHPCVFIAYECEIGNRCEIQPNTSLGTAGYGYAQNENYEHIQIPHYGKLIIEHDVTIGTNVSIDRGTYDNTVIGRGTKIDNHCHLAHNFTVGTKGLITAGFIAAGTTKIGDNFVCGGRTSLGGHMNITDNVRLGALSTVVKDIPESGNYAGWPLRKHLDAIKYQALLPSLPEMKKTLAKIKKKLDL